MKLGETFVEAAELGCEHALELFLAELFEYAGELPGGGRRYSGFDLNGAWVPLYAFHKVFAGLLDAHAFSAAILLGPQFQAGAFPEIMQETVWFERKQVAQIGLD